MYECKDGKRIAFRYIKESDTDMVLSWRNSTHVRKYFLHKLEITREEHLNWLKTKVGTGKVVQFIVCDVLNENTPFASVYFRDVDRENKTAEYGVFIGKMEYIGKGYGQEIARLMVSYGFGNMGLRRITLRVYTDNIRAIHCYEKVGFKICGTMLNDDSADGRDVCFMEINKGGD